MITSDTVMGNEIRHTIFYDFIKTIHFTINAKIHESFFPIKLLVVIS